jgi:hypothetical protein
MLNLKHQTMQKLNVLLALREKLQKRYSQMVGDYTGFFKNKQSAFQGKHGTYDAQPGYSIDTQRVFNERVITTVDEKFNWWLKEALDYINTTLTIEASNGQGAPKAPIVFEGKSYGPFPATVLLRLKGIIEDSKLNDMFKVVPVRTETVIWNNSKDADYAERGIKETELKTYEDKTTESHEEILKDPNINPENIPSNYRAQTTTIKATVKKGEYTTQFFTGEWTHEQRAKLLQRRSALLDALTVALQEVNDTEAEKCDVTDLFEHLIYGI